MIIIGKIYAASIALDEALRGGMARHDGQIVPVNQSNELSQSVEGRLLLKAAARKTSDFLQPQSVGRYIPLQYASLPFHCGFATAGYYACFLQLKAEHDTASYWGSQCTRKDLSP